MFSTFTSTLGTSLSQVTFADANGNSTHSATQHNHPAFTFGTPATYFIAQLASRWQSQLGVRYLV